MLDPIDVRLRLNAVRRADYARERDELIREAKAARLPVTHIAKSASLSRMQVHRILAGHGARVDP